MTRKSFLKRLAALPVLSAIWRYLPARALDASPSLPVRRLRASDAAWPGAASWEKLNQMVGGRLLKVESPLAACRGGTDSEAREKVIKDLQNPFYVGDQPCWGEMVALGPDNMTNVQITIRKNPNQLKAEFFNVHRSADSAAEPRPRKRQRQETRDLPTRGRSHLPAQIARP
jgi:hypothetical protein